MVLRAASDVTHRDACRLKSFPRACRPGHVRRRHGAGRQQRLRPPSLTESPAPVLVRSALGADACCGAPQPPDVSDPPRGRDGEPDLSDAVEPAIASAVLHHGLRGAWVEAIRIAAYENQPDDVLHDMMRTAARTTGPEVIDGVVAATAPPPGAERLAMLDRAAQDVEDQRRRDGLSMRVARPRAA